SAISHRALHDALPISNDHARAARRAYYGAISYVDDQISRLLAVLRDTGRLDNTVVVITSDHGEMLGERGAWYKMSCYEGAARVRSEEHTSELQSLTNL